MELLFTVIKQSLSTQVAFELLETGSQTFVLFDKAAGDVRCCTFKMTVSQECEPLLQMLIALRNLGGAAILENACATPWIEPSMPRTILPKRSEADYSFAVHTIFGKKVCSIYPSQTPIDGGGIEYVGPLLMGNPPPQLFQGILKHHHLRRELFKLLEEIIFLSYLSKNRNG